MKAPIGVDEPKLGNEGHMGYKEENKSRKKEGRRHYRIHINIEHGTILR